MENALEAIEAILESLVNQYGSPQVIDQTNIVVRPNQVVMVIAGSINVNGSATYYRATDSVSDIFENAKRRIEWADRIKEENKTEAP